MRLPIWFMFIGVLVALAAVLAVGRILIQPDRPLLAYAQFSLNTITPNADGDSDVTLFTYEITRNAFVTLTFEDGDDHIFNFRTEQRRVADEYQVQFSGVVDGYTLSNEEIAGTVLRRLIPNGTYTWHLHVAAQDDNETVDQSGTLVVADADLPLPEMIEFTVSPEIFTPNQDGIHDRTQINVFLTKDADMTLYLLNAAGERIFIPRREECRDEGEAGRQCYDYEGGVDIGADPPPDGTYTVVAMAQDAEGQQIERRSTLTIAQGGKPRAEIAAQPTGPTVAWLTRPYDDGFFTTAGAPGDLIPMPDGPDVLSLNEITMPVGDLLIFKLTVSNYSNVPIRTSGPPPGTVYDQTQVDASTGWYEQPGVWRVGIQCDTSTESYPWRWAIGSSEDLETVVGDNDETFYYLPAGEQAVVWGAIRMTEIVDTQNPQNCWAGLIHESVEVTLENQNVEPRRITLVEVPTESGTGGDD